MKVKAKKYLVKRVRVFAHALNVHDFKLTITHKKGFTECSRKSDGSFVINLVPDLDKYWQTRSLAHEMVHLKQYKHDELTGHCDDGMTYWKGQKFFPVGFMEDDAYWLSPWEMEARALEDWLVYKWETR